MKTLWGREPSAIIGLLEAAIVLGLAFGLNLSTAQVSAITAFAVVLLAVVTRSQVVPVRKQQ